MTSTNELHEFAFSYADVEQYIPIRNREKKKKKFECEKKIAIFAATQSFKGYLDGTAEKKGESRVVFYLFYKIYCDIHLFFFIVFSFSFSFSFTVGGNEENLPILFSS